MKLIDKDALVAEIEKQRQLIFPKNTGEMKVADVPKPLEQGWLNALSWMKKTIDSLEVKEVDLEHEVESYWKQCDMTWCRDAYSMTHIRSMLSDIAKHFFELGLKGE